MKNYFLLIALLVNVFVNQLTAQEKMLTTADAAWLNPDLFTENIQQLQWFGDTDSYVFAADKAVIITQAKNDKSDTLCTLDAINTLLTKIEADSTKRIPRFNWLEDETAWFFHKSGLYQYNPQSESIRLITQLPENASNQDVHQNTLNVAYTIDNNLYLAKGNTHIQLTDEPGHNVCGQAVHRNEFGISKGIFWSPDGQKLAFYKMDEHMVTNYPLVNTETRIASLKNERYTMAGMTSHEVKLNIYDLTHESTTILETGEPAEQYLTAVSWHPSGNMIYCAVLNRGQNHLKLNAYDANEGSFIQTLFEETDEQYVEPQFPLYFVPENENEFLWLSERDGFWHIYVYNTNGEQLKQLTQGEWVVTDFLGFDAKSKHVFFTATAESPLERHTYKVNLKSGKMQRITIDTGVHRTIPSKTSNYFLDSYSNLTTPKNIILLNDNAEIQKTLLEAANKLQDYKLGHTQLLTLAAEDKTPLYARMITPPNLDSTKKYPVIVYVYGGPHAQLVTNSWLGGGNFYLNYLAQQGYIVFTLDNRGSANRGADFEQIIHRNLGVIERADQLKGVEYLKTLSFVDTARIGVDGWSYGGFMSMGLKLHHPEIFKTATAGGPVTDWKYYEIMYGERYMDTPDENPEGYETSSLINKADLLEGNLLIIHGTSDPVVVWQQSLAFLQAAIDAGVLVDYFVYPGHEHNIRGANREHLIKKISHYFKENL
ncbi:MAG: DPP IV N-terminal domain-containing protein [Bacteroidetes bacterium]|nr:DPP IV N-terminal domain-containing protein [Bacteroidota bacterium]MBU1578427.1 DPP IV N-terminal domain-containing protein [Bacteroidota bacterium]